MTKVSLGLLALMVSGPFLLPFHTEPISLFRQLGAEFDEREGSGVKVFLFGLVRVFHHPHPAPNTDK
jgi:hypothetical protein